MIKQAAFLGSLAAVALFLGACAPPAAAPETPEARMETPAVGPASLSDTPPPTVETAASETAEPTLQPTAQPPTDPPEPLPGPVFTGVSGGGQFALYPAQDISIIAQTGNVQFLNFYANW